MRIDPALPVPDAGRSAGAGGVRDVLVLRHYADRPARSARAAGWGIAALLIVAALALPFVLGKEPGAKRTINRPHAEARTLLPPVHPVELVIYDTDVMPIASQLATKINAERPVDIAKPRSAAPFAARWQGDADPHQTAAVTCLASAIYYEAASESEEGQRAVAQVVLNRVRHPAFPNSVCGVVYQGANLATGCQFSFTCDGSLARLPSRAGWARAERIARNALSGAVAKEVGNATHYHANYVVPYWSPTLDKAATIGAHIFYIMRGSLGAARAFSMRYDPNLEAIPAAPAAIAVDPSAIIATPTDVQQPGVGGLMVRPQEDHRVGTLIDGAAAPIPGLKTPLLRADERRGELVAGKVGGLPGSDERSEPGPEPKSQSAPPR